MQHAACSSYMKLEKQLTIALRQWKVMKPCVEMTGCDTPNSSQQFGEVGGGNSPHVHWYRIGNFS